MSLRTSLEKVGKRYKLLPPCSEAEIQQVKKAVGCSLPHELEEALRFARGLSGLPGALGTVDLSGLSVSGQHVEELFPHCLSLASDRCGNSWNLEVLANPPGLGAIYFVCHDPPILVLESPSAEEFVAEIRTAVLGEQQRKAPSLTYEQALSRDPELAEFARTLGEKWEFADLRAARPGDGFTWGRYGANTELRRCGRSALFALGPPLPTPVPKVLSWFRRILERWKP